MIRSNMRRQRAFTLLEFLVTLLIVSLALLGIAGLITASLKNDQGSSVRSQATILAADIIDRMRANRPAAEGTNPSPYNLAIGASPATTGIPQSDLTDWRAALAATLPAGTGSVNLDGTTRKLTVVVQWDDSRASGGSGAQQLSIETRL
jgi:type IV pilus assembly protein PilV